MTEANDVRMIYMRGRNEAGHWETFAVALEDVQRAARMPEDGNVREIRSEIVEALNDILARTSRVGPLLFEETTVYGAIVTVLAEREARLRRELGAK